MNISCGGDTLFSNGTGLAALLEKYFYFEALFVEEELKTTVVFSGRLKG
ncbi:Hypothetical protein Cp262_0449 [Corynebacterium pseudotuberculosis]|nr:Hypothetical protein Cp262_0449 [Corynebacterium pseudotuberculosis]